MRAVRPSRRVHAHRAATQPQRQPARRSLHDLARPAGSRSRGSRLSPRHLGRARAESRLRPGRQLVPRCSNAGREAGLRAARRHGHRDGGRPPAQRQVGGEHATAAVRPQWPAASAPGRRRACRPRGRALGRLAVLDVQLRQPLLRRSAARQRASARAATRAFPPSRRQRAGRRRAPRARRDRVARARGSAASRCRARGPRRPRPARPSSR